MSIPACSPPAVGAAQSSDDRQSRAAARARGDLGREAASARDYDRGVATAESPAIAGALSRVPSPALVLGGIASVQFGSAIATKLFHSVGPGGAVLLRLVTAIPSGMCSSAW